MKCLMIGYIMDSLVRTQPPSCWPKCGASGGRCNTSSNAPPKIRENNCPPPTSCQPMSSPQQGSLREAREGAVWRRPKYPGRRTPEGILINQGVSHRIRVVYDRPPGAMIKIRYQHQTRGIGNINISLTWYFDEPKSGPSSPSRPRPVRRNLVATKAYGLAEEAHPYQIRARLDQTITLSSRQSWTSPVRPSRTDLVTRS